MLSTILLQAGTISKHVARATYEAHRRGVLGDILSSGWFWGIVAFIVVCVVIYNLLKD